MSPTALECSGAPWRILNPNRTGISPFSADVWGNPAEATWVSSPRLRSAHPQAIAGMQWDRAGTSCHFAEVSPTLRLSLEGRLLDPGQNLFWVCEVYASNGAKFTVTWATPQSFWAQCLGNEEVGFCETCFVLHRCSGKLNIELLNCYCASVSRGRGSSVTMTKRTSELFIPETESISRGEEPWSDSSKLP